MSTGCIDPQAGLRELLEFSQKLAQGLGNLRAAAGVEAGCSERETVYRDGKIALHRYRSIAPPAGVAPLLICFGFVNRPWMMDLQPDRSLIRRLLERGLDVYLVDWGYPDGAERFDDLADYLEGYLHDCVSHVLDTHAIDALNLLGVCQGGTFSLCYTALHPERVRNLITMVTPVDFHTPENLLAKWIRGIDVDALVDSQGNVSGELLNVVFLSLMPFRLTQQKYVGLVDVLQNPQQVENFVRMEKWIFDSPDHPGEVFRQFARAFFQGNALLAGSLEIDGRRVDLRNITQPVLNVFAQQDHLVPPSASLALGRCTGSKDYSTFSLDVGHIGIYVSGKSQRELPDRIATWLKERTTK